MKVILLTIAALTIIQALVAGIITIKTKEDEAETQTTSEEALTKKQRSKEKQLKELRVFDFKTLLIALAIGAMIIVAFSTYKKTHNLYLSKKAAAIITVMYFVYCLYTSTDNYNDFNYIKEMLVNQTASRFKLVNLANTVAIVGLMYCLFSIYGDPIVLLAKEGTTIYQLLMIMYTVLTILVLLLLCVTCIIEMTYYIKYASVNQKVLNLHSKFIKSLHLRKPSRVYIRKKRKWKPSKKEYFILLVLDSLYIIPATVLLFFDSILMAIYKGISGAITTSGQLLGVSFEEPGVIGSSSLLFKLFGWAFIVAITVTYAMIIFSANYSEPVREIYSFITGIIVIPAIISASIKHNTN